MRNELAVLVVLVTVGCTGGTDAATDTRGYTVRDSAGIEIVENDQPLWTDADRWRIGEEPAASIGIADGEAPYLLDGVAGAVRLGDGRIAIADQGSAQLRFYDADGRFLNSAGRKGNGPGEFARPDHLVRLPGDSLAVWDAGFRPYSVFTPAGDFVRQQRVETDHVMATITMKRATEALTPLSDGSFIIHATQRGNPHEMGVPPGVVYRSPMGFYRFRSDGVDSLGWFAGGLPNIYLQIGGRARYATVLVPWYARLAASADARRVFITEGDPYEIVEFLDGKRVRVIRRNSAPIEIPEDVLERARESWRAWGSLGVQRRRVQEALPPQTHWPAIRELDVDSEGYLWVTTYAEDTHVFDREGRWLGTVKVPGGRLLDVGSDYVVTLSFDSLRVERVAVHQLTR